MARESDTALALLAAYVLYRAYSAGSEAVSAVVAGAKDAVRAVAKTPEEVKREVGNLADDVQRFYSGGGPRFDGSIDDERNAIGRMLASETDNQDAWPWMIASVVRWSRMAKKSVESVLAPPSLGGKWGKHNRDGVYVYASTAQKATGPTLAAYDAAAQNWDRFMAAHPDVISFVEGADQYKGHVVRNPELSLKVKVGQWYFLERT